MADSSEYRGDLARVLQKQYQVGHNTGYAHGFADAKELYKTIRRELCVILFCAGSAIGLLVGIFLP